MSWIRKGNPSIPFCPAPMAGPMPLRDARPGGGHVEEERVVSRDDEHNVCGASRLLVGGQQSIGIDSCRDPVPPPGSSPLAL